VTFIRFHTSKSIMFYKVWVVWRFINCNTITSIGIYYWIFDNPEYYTWEDWLTSDTFIASISTLARAQSLSLSLINIIPLTLFLSLFLFLYASVIEQPLNYNCKFCSNVIQNEVCEIERIFRYASCTYTRRK